MLTQFLNRLDYRLALLVFHVIKIAAAVKVGLIVLKLILIVQVMFMLLVVAIFLLWR